jgi:hypothetical protein
VSSIDMASPDTYLGFAATTYFACNEYLLSFCPRALQRLLIRRRWALGCHVEMRGVNTIDRDGNRHRLSRIFERPISSF